MSLPAFLSYLTNEKNYATLTIGAYKKDISEFSEFLNSSGAGAAIDDANYPMIRNWIVTLVDEGISTRTINRKMSALKSYYRFLQKIKVNNTNPLSGHKALKVNKKVEVPLSENEMEALFAAIPFKDNFVGTRDKLIIELLYTTGMRRAELLQLQLADIDLANCRLKVLGKRNKERILPLLPPVVQSLEKYLGYRQNVINTTGEKAVFLTKNGHKIYETLVYRLINKYLGMVSPKVKKSPHILRHTFATHLLNKGADLNAVKELLGHSSLASTQVYTHNSISELKKVHQMAHPRNK